MTAFRHALRVAALGAAFVLAACGTAVELRDLAVVKGAEAYDEALITSEIFMCRGASIGSVLRRYGTAPDRAQAWRTLCMPDGEAAVILIGPDAPE